MFSVHCTRGDDAAVTELLNANKASDRLALNGTIVRPTSCLSSPAPTPQPPLLSGEISYPSRATTSLRSGIGCVTFSVASKKRPRRQQQPCSRSLLTLALISSYRNAKNAPRAQSVTSHRRNHTRYSLKLFLHCFPNQLPAHVKFSTH